MRKTFANELYKQMKQNKDIWLITGDLGFGLFQDIRKDFPDRFFNPGAAEQSMMGIAVGLALEGKIPVVYSITPFLLYRPYETIRNYINHEKIKVILIGSGRNQDYEHDGFSHFAGDDKRVMRNLIHIQAFWPEHKEDIASLLDEAIKGNKPVYINLKR